MNELERLYKQSKPRHMRSLKKILRGQGEEAEDIFQEAFCRALAYYPSYNPKLSSLSNWFARIVYNELRRFLKKNKRVNDLVEDTRWEEESIDYSNLLESRSVVESYLKREWPSDNRTMLELIYLYGYSAREVGEMFEVGKNELKQICNRFRESIKNEQQSL